jgi:hypothetical protein
MARCASASRPSRSEDCDVAVLGTNVNINVTKYPASLQGEGRRALARQVEIYGDGDDR